MRRFKMMNATLRVAVTLGKSFLLLLLLCVALAFGCRKANGPTELTGSSKATLKFWDTIQSPLPRNTMFSRMGDFQYETASSQDMQAFGLVMNQMADTCREKANQITSESVAGVDVDAANYGVQKAQVLFDYAKLFDSITQLAENQNNLTSGQDLLLGYLSALGRHADEGENAWLNAGKEEFTDKAKSFGNLQVEGHGIADYARNLRDEVSQLQTSEMQTRIALTQRYRQEFPTGQSLINQRPATVPIVFGSEKLGKMQPSLARDLVGRTISTATDGTWTFDSPSEYVSLDVLHGTNYGDVLDFVISTHVRGMFSGAEHNFNLLMTYQHNNGNYRLMFVKPL